MWGEPQIKLQAVRRKISSLPSQGFETLILEQNMTLKKKRKKKRKRGGSLEVVDVVDLKGVGSSGYLSHFVIAF